MNQIEITAELLNSLAAKLDAAGLNPDETAVVNAVLERASSAEAEVEGYYMYGTTALRAEQAGGGDSYMLGWTYLEANDLGPGARRWSDALS